MPRIPEPEIERIKRHTDLAALVRARGVELHKHGSKDFSEFLLPEPRTLFTSSLPQND